MNHISEEQLISMTDTQLQQIAAQGKSALGKNAQRLEEVTERKTVSKEKLQALAKYLQKN